MRSYFLPDDPSDEDTLERGEVLAAVQSLINNDPHPRVIGIHGDWGAGKTSFLIQLEKKLTNGRQRMGETAKEVRRGEGGAPVVWFEAWRYQHDDQPIVTLLHEIREQLSPGRRFWQKMTKTAVIATESAVSVISGAAEALHVKADTEKIRKIADRYERERYEVPSSTVAISDLLESAISAVLRTWPANPRPTRLVVLIDDLDRCEADMAQKLLEGLKVFLNLNNCIFVIAMDEEIVVEFITKKFKSEDLNPTLPDALPQIRRRARKYLEKLCQGVYHLPYAPHPVELFLKYLDDAIRGSVQVNQNGELPEITAMRDVFENVPIMAHPVPPNPRKIKIIAAVTARFCHPIGSLKTDTERADQAALAYALGYSYQLEPKLFRLIEEYGVAIFRDWLLPLCKNEPIVAMPPRETLEVKLPSALLKDAPLFEEPMSGQFYPAWVLRGIDDVTPKMLVEALA